MKCQNTGKFAALLLAGILLLPISAMPVRAAMFTENAAASDYEFETDGVTWYLGSPTATAVYLSHCVTDQTEITIPTEHDGLPVRLASDFFGKSSDTIASVTVKADNTYYTARDGVLFNAAMTELIGYPRGKTDSAYAIPEGVKTMRSSAIMNNAFLRRVDIPASMTSGIPFSGCPKLSIINVATENTRLSVVNGMLIDNDQHEICRRPPQTVLTTCNIPDGTERIGAGAFMDNTRIRSLTLPDSVNRIEDDAFNGCSQLTDINIPEGVQLLCNRVFAGCTALAAITIPDSITHISNGAFQNCESLQEVTIPASVNTISNGAFSGMTNLQTITILNPEMQFSTQNIPVICNAYDTETKTGTFTLTIRGHENSTAQTYAGQYGIAFEVLPPPYTPGDVDEDGAVSAIDAALVLTYAAQSGSGEPEEQSETWRNAADYNEDGAIDAVDAAGILIAAAAAGAGNE